MPPPLHRTRRGHWSAEWIRPDRSGELGLQRVPLVGKLVDDGVGVAASARRLEDRGRIRLRERAPPEDLARELVETYAAVLPGELGGAALARVDRAGFERVRFGWAGSLVPNEPQYWRMQGPTFVLEFDNSRNGGTHIHSVWRDFQQDFGRHLA